MPLSGVWSARCRHAVGALHWRFWHQVGCLQRSLAALDAHLACWHVPHAGLSCAAPAAQPPLHVLATRAHLLAQLGRWPDACDQLQQLHALAPQSAAHAFNLGFVHMHMGDAAAAERAFRACLASAPHMDQAWLGLGQALHAQADWQGAQAAWAQQVRLQPLCPDGYTALVKLHIQRQDLLAARAWLDRLRAFDPRQALALEPHMLALPKSVPATAQAWMSCAPVGSKASA